MQEKVLASLIAGVFIGALAFELMNRKKPNLVDGLKKNLDDCVDGFKRGYSKKDAQAV